MVTKIARRPRSSLRARLLRSTRVVGLASMAVASSAQALPVPAAGPLPKTGAPPTTLGGSAQVSSGGSLPTYGVSSSGRSATVGLGAARTLIDWSSFNVDAGQTVNFQFGTAGAHDIVLNRVDAGSTTSISGTVNGLLGDSGAFGGNIWVFSPGGLLINSGAAINAGGLLLSTARVSAAQGLDFLNGAGTDFTFGSSAPTGRIQVDSGAALRTYGGTLALIAPVVDVQPGALIGATGAADDPDAPTLARSSVLYGAAQSFEIQFVDKGYSGLDLFRFVIPANGGVADFTTTPLTLAGTTRSGAVYMAGVNASGVIERLIDASGSVFATRASASGDTIVLNAGGGLETVGGALAASAAPAGAAPAGASLGGTLSAAGGGVSLQAQGTGAELDVTGKLASTLADGNGGRIIATGDRISLAPTAVLDASGKAGGLVLVGGDVHGGADPAANFSAAPVPTASDVTVEPGATIRALGTAGAGGDVVVWSNGTTSFDGRIIASGAGAGGFVETSGEGRLLVGPTASVTASGSTGAGTWLLDPTQDSNVTIETGGAGDASGGSYSPTADNSTVDVATVESALHGGTSVTINTANGGGGQEGDITLADALTIAAAATGPATLTLNAGSEAGGGAGKIAINAPIDDSGSGKALSLAFNAGGGVNFASNVTIGGTLQVNAGSHGAGDITQSGVLTVGGASSFTDLNSGSAITLGSNNALTGAVTLTTTGTASSATLKNTLATTLAGSASNIAGSLSVTTTGSVGLTVDSALTTHGATTLDAGSGPLVLNGVATSGNLTLTTTGTVTLDAGTYTITGGASPYVFPAVTTNGTLTLGQPTTFGVVTLASNTIVDSTNTAIDFNGAVSATTSGGQSLTVNAGNGVVTFGGAVGSVATPLASLDVTGPTTLDGNVTTTGTQTYRSAVTLGAADTLTTTNAAVDFVSTVNGSQALTVNAGTGAVTFGGAVGSVATPLASLDVTGPTTLDGNVTTTGTQTYRSAVTLGAADTLTTTNAAVDFVSTVNGSQALTVNAGAGVVTFGDAVGGLTPLASLDVTGPTTLDGNVTTTGTQTYHSAVTLGSGPLTLASTAAGNITFSGTVDGAQALEVDTSGNEVFSGLVGSGTALTSLTTDAAGTVGGSAVFAMNNGAAPGVSAGSVTVHDAVVFDGGSTAHPLVATTGSQTYSGAAMLSGDTTLIDSAGGAVTFSGTVDGAHALEVDTSGNEVFDGLVGSGTALTSLTTDAAGTVGGSAIFGMDPTTAAAGVAGVKATSVTVHDQTSFTHNSTSANPMVSTTGPQNYVGAATAQYGLALASDGLMFSTLTTNAAPPATPQDTVLTFGAGGISYTSIDTKRGLLYLLGKGSGGGPLVVGDNSGDPATITDTELSHTNNSVSGGRIIIGSAGDVYVEESTVTTSAPISIDPQGSVHFDNYAAPGSVTATFAGDLDVTTPGGVSQLSSSDVLTTPVLTGSVGTSASFLGTANQIATLGAFATGTGFTFFDTPATTLTQTGSVNGGTGAILIDNGGKDFTQSGTLTTTNATSAAVTIQHTGALSVGTISASAGTVTFGTSTASVGAVTEPGGITANALQGYSTGSVALTGSNAISNLGNFTTAGNFTFDDTPTSPQLTQTAGTTVDAGSGAILIDTGGKAFGQAGTLTTTNATTAAVTIQHTAALAVGTITASAGTVTLGTDAATLGTSTSLPVAGPITETGSITANALQGYATGSATLGAAANNVANLGGFTAAGFTFFDTPTATLAQTAGTTVNAGSSDILIDNGGKEFDQTGTLATTAGDVTIQHTAALQVGTITASAGTVTLGASASLPVGAITETGSITANALQGYATGSATLDAGANNVANLGGFTAAGFTFYDTPTGALTQSGGTAVNAPSGSILIDNGGKDFVLGGTLSAANGDATVRNVGVLTVSGGISVSGTATLGTAAAPIVTITAPGTIETSVLSSYSTSNTTISDAFATTAGFHAGGTYSLSDGDAVTASGAAAAISIGAPAITETGLTAGTDIGLVAASGDITLAGAVSAGGTVTLTASSGAIDEVGTPTVSAGGDLILAGQSFQIGAPDGFPDYVHPAFIGRDLSIEATGAGFSAGGLSAPNGDIRIEVLSGGVSIASAGAADDILVAADNGALTLGGASLTGSTDVSPPSDGLFLTGVGSGRISDVGGNERQLDLVATGQVTFGAGSGSTPTAGQAFQVTGGGAAIDAELLSTSGGVAVNLDQSQPIRLISAGAGDATVAVASGAAEIGDIYASQNVSVTAAGGGAILGFAQAGQGDVTVAAANSVLFELQSPTASYTIAEATPGAAAASGSILITASGGSISGVSTLPVFSAGANLSALANGGDAVINSATAGGAAYLYALDNASASALLAGGDATEVAGGNAFGGTISAGQDAGQSAGAGASAGLVHGGRDAVQSAGIGATVSSLLAGRDAVQSAGTDATASTLLAGRDASQIAGGAAIVDTIIAAQDDVLVSASGSASIAKAVAGKAAAELSPVLPTTFYSDQGLAGEPAGDGSNIAVSAGTTAIIHSATAERDIRIAGGAGSTGSAQLIGSFAAGDDITVTAGGLVDTSQATLIADVANQYGSAGEMNTPETSGSNITLSGGVVSAASMQATGSISAAADVGSLTLVSSGGAAPTVLAGGDIDLVGQTGVSAPAGSEIYARSSYAGVDSPGVANSVTITANTGDVSLGPGTAAVATPIVVADAAAAITATTGNIMLDRADAGGSAIVSAGQAATLGDLLAGGDATILAGGAIAVADRIGAYGSVSAVSTGGGVWALKAQAGAGSGPDGDDGPAAGLIPAPSNPSSTHDVFLKAGGGAAQVQNAWGAGDVTVWSTSGDAIAGRNQANTTTAGEVRAGDDIIVVANTDHGRAWLAAGTEITQTSDHASTQYDADFDAAGDGQTVLVRGFNANVGAIPSDVSSDRMGADATAPADVTSAEHLALSPNAKLTVAADPAGGLASIRVSRRAGDPTYLPITSITGGDVFVENGDGTTAGGVDTEVMNAVSGDDIYVSSYEGAAILRSGTLNDTTGAPGDGLDNLIVKATGAGKDALVGANFGFDANGQPTYAPTAATTGYTVTGLNPSTGASGADDFSVLSTGGDAVVNLANGYRIRTLSGAGDAFAASASGIVQAWSATAGEDVGLFTQDASAGDINVEQAIAGHDILVDGGHDAELRNADLAGTTATGEVGPLATSFDPTATGAYRLVLSGGHSAVLGANAGLTPHDAPPVVTLAQPMQSVVDVIAGSGNVDVELDQPSSQLTTVTAAQAANVNVTGDLTLGTLTAGGPVAVTAADNAVVGSVASTGSSASVTATNGTATVASLSAAGDGKVSAGQDADVTTASVGGTGAINAGHDINLGTLTAGEAATLTAANDVTVTGGVASTNADVTVTATSGAANIASLSAATDATVTANQSVGIGSLAATNGIADIVAGSHTSGTADYGLTISQLSVGKDALLDAPGTIAVASGGGSGIAGTTYLIGSDLEITGPLKVNALSIQARTGAVALGDGAAAGGLTLGDAEFGNIQSQNGTSGATVSIYGGLYGLGSNAGEFSAVVPADSGSTAAGNVNIGSLSIDSSKVANLNIYAQPTQTVSITGAFTPTSTANGAVSLRIGGSGDPGQQPGGATDAATTTWQPQLIEIINGGSGGGTGSIGSGTYTGPNTAPSPRVGFGSVVLNAAQDIVMGTSEYVAQAESDLSTERGANASPAQVASTIGNDPKLKAMFDLSSDELVVANSLTLNAQTGIVQQNIRSGGPPGQSGGIDLSQRGDNAYALAIGRTGDAAASGSTVPDVVQLFLTLTDQNGTLIPSQTVAASQAITFVNGAQRSGTYRVNGCVIGAPGNCTPQDYVPFVIQPDRLTEVNLLDRDEDEDFEDPTITGAANEEIWRKPEDK